MDLNLFKRYSKWKDRRFLKKHGCKTWAQYNKKYDPDHNSRADLIPDYYHGYPYVHCFENYSHHAYRLLYDYGPGGCKSGIDEIQEWAFANCQEKVRFDLLRVFKQGAIGFDNSVTEEWCINEIGGGDLLFAAFKDERDYLMFSLRWA